MQQAVCHLVRRDSSAIKFGRVEIVFISALYLLANTNKMNYDLQQNLKTKADPTHTVDVQLLTEDAAWIPILLELRRRRRLASVVLKEDDGLENIQEKAN